MEFNELNLHADIQRGISEAGYITCMPVQEQVLANAFGGQDLYVQSQTGTGKTAAFLVVIFQRLLTEPLLAGKKAIIMVPTRELAVQVEDEAKVLGKYLPFKIGSFYGGVGYTEQQQLLRDNVQILVGTPGRVLDLNGSGRMNLMDIAFLILDEADRMFDMGFYPDLRKLIKVVPPADRRQTMLFSATLNNWVKNLAWEYTKNPLEIEIAPEHVTVEEIDQILYHVPSNDKMRLLLGLFEREKPESAIIFCNTKRYAEIVAKRLRINGIDCEFIMGDLPQAKRLKIIEDVKAGKTRFLVATDVAARGLDIESLAMVVNYDLPSEAENYVHRIGRTARAGKTGRAVTLASEQDVYELTPIERYLGKKIPSETATAELYGEDKSEGMRIYTDFRDVGGRDRGSRGGGRDESRPRGESRGRGGAFRGSGRPPRSQQRPFAEARAEEGRGSSQGGEPRPDRDRKERSPGPRQREQEIQRDEDISRLSFDERMAYYKRKYVADGQRRGGRNRDGDERDGSPGPAAAGKPRPAERGTRPANAETTAGKNGGRRGGLAGGNSGRNSGGRRGSGSGRAGRDAAKAVPAGSGIKEATPAAGPAKKGLIKRFLGIFKKEP
jgi:ATP-dependent RNA helicase RhlB